MRKSNQKIELNNASKSIITSSTFILGGILLADAFNSLFAGSSAIASFIMAGASLSICTLTYINSDFNPNKMEKQ